MELQSDAYAIPSTDASAVQTVAADLTASGAQDVLTLSGTEASDLLNEISQAAHASLTRTFDWTSSNHGPCNYPALAALYKALGGTEKYVLTGITDPNWP